MDLKKYGLDELLLVAIKSEIESEKVYREVSKRVKDPFLKNRLEFLANEERGHRNFLENLFVKNFPKHALKIPEKSAVPLPEVHMYGESGTMRDVVAIMDDAMKAESAAADFYTSLMELFEDEKTKQVLKYLALMEKDHYAILKRERDQLAEVEDVMEDLSYIQLDGQY
jgi:rubrerythrin